MKKVIIFKELWTGTQWFKHCVMFPFLWPIAIKIWVSNWEKLSKRYDSIKTKGKALQDLMAQDLCLITGDKTSFKYKGMPVKEEIFKIAQKTRKDFTKETGKQISMAKALDEVANHIQDGFRAKMKDYKEDLQKEADKLEGEVENEKKISDKPRLSIAE